MVLLIIKELNREGEMVLKAKLSKGGKVSIPSAARKYLNLKEGEDIVFSIKKGEVVIFPLRVSLEKARKLVNKYCPKDESLVDKLINERRAEAKNE